jgi:hypothetical protein
MTNETTPQAPEAGATEVVSTPPPTEQARGPDGKFASQTPPDGKTGATTEAEAPERADDEPQEDQQQKKKRDNGERFRRMEAEKREALREAARLRAEIEALRRPPERQVDHDDYDAQQAELFRGVMREERIGEAAQKYQQAVQRSLEVQAQAFWAKVDDARERIPDIDQSMAMFRSLPIPDDSCEIIAESDYAAEIAHYLVTSPEGRKLAGELAMYSPAKQGRELARIEAKFNLPTRRTSTAPPPPPSVTGAQPARERSPQEMSASEYMEWRQKQWKSGAR